MKLSTRAPIVLGDAEMKQVWEAALRVWERVPLRAQGTPEFNEALQAFGCEIRDDRVTFPAAVREKTLARIAEGRERNGEGHPAEIARDDLTYAASGQALYMCDVEDDRLRPATEQDLADWSRRDVHAFATIILNSSRPWRVSVYTAEMLPYFVELQALCEGGVDAVKAAPAFAAKCWYNSPFMITRENIEIGMKAREVIGQPFTVSTMPVAGIATPATIAGALVHITAEILGCNVISLALDDRLCGYCAGALTFDMRTGIHTQTGPDVQLLRNGCAQMGAHVFGGAYVSVGGPSTAAKTPGAQSMMEKALDTMWAVCGGVRNFGSLGTLAFADVGSPVQLLLDIEMMQHFEHLLKGIQVDEGRLAEDLICEIAPTGAYYLATDHTAAYHREELWAPELMDRRVPMAWDADPTTMVDNARLKAQRVLAEAPNKCPLSGEQKEEVARIVAAADAQVTQMRRG